MIGYRVRVGWLRPALVALVCLVPSAVWAGVGDIFGDVRQIPVPASVEPGAIPEDEGQFVSFFREQNVRLRSDVFVDQTPGGGAGEVSRGTCARSYYVVFNPEDIARTGQGRLEFERRVLGVVSSQETLEASDDECGLAGTTYPSALDCAGPGEGSCGLETLDVIDVHPRAIDVEFHASGVGDRVRVLTEGDPAECQE